MQQVWSQGPLSGAQADLATLDFGGPTAWRDGCTLNRISLVVSPGAGCMRRRDFIQVIAGSVAAWPLAARAQQPAMPVVGYFTLGAPEQSASYVAPFRRGLSEVGYVEGQNVAIEYRWAHNEVGRLPELATDLVRRRVAVIATPSMPAALAAKAATTTIPIVFSSAGDPVQTGLVARLKRPGGTVTGLSDLGVELWVKRLRLLLESLPGAERFGALVNRTTSPSIELLISEVQTAASAIGRQIEVFNVSTNRDIDTAFTNLVRKRIDALLVGPQVLFPRPSCTNPDIGGAPRSGGNVSRSGVR